MITNRLYLSTIAADAERQARRLNLGLEIAEYCTAWNMDERFPQTDSLVREKLNGVDRRIFHAPFNELFPCAIDPRARELAAFRYRQAMVLAESYGAEKIVIHGGYSPRLYYPCWYREESIAFWKSFLAEAPGLPIALENVMEEEPEMLLDIIRGVDDPRLRLCLDVGHVNVYSHVPADIWLERCAPFISHFHIHNNHGSQDTHSALHQGSVDMDAFLSRAEALCPEATFTLELMETEPSLRILMEISPCELRK